MDNSPRDVCNRGPIYLIAPSLVHTTYPGVRSLFFSRMANFTGIGSNPLLQVCPAIPVYPDHWHYGGQNGCSSEVCHPRKKGLAPTPSCASAGGLKRPRPAEWDARPQPWRTEASGAREKCLTLASSCASPNGLRGPRPAEGTARPPPLPTNWRAPGKFLDLQRWMAFSTVLTLGSEPESPPEWSQVRESRPSTTPGVPPGILGGSSQSGAQSIVYELDTLRHKARHGLEQLSLVILCSCTNKSQTTTTEQCQVAAGSIWDGPIPGSSRISHP